MNERRCCEHIPEKRHGEVPQHRSDPYRRKPQDRLSAQYDLKNERRYEAHRRTHDEDDPRLPHNTAEVGVVRLRIAVPLHEPRPRSVAYKV